MTQRGAGQDGRYQDGPHQQQQPGTALLLGARGFLGAHVAPALSAAGWRLRSPSGVDVNRLTDAALDELLAGAELVVNAAGRTRGTPAALLDANARLPARLLERLPQEARLIHLGSAAEYGRGQGEQPAREDDPCAPLSAYGVSKLAGTLLLAADAQTRVEAQARATVLRVFNPLGAGMDGASLPGRAARELRRAVQEGRPWVRFGPLAQRRDFLDARDIASAVVHLADAAAHAPLPPIVNVGSGVATSGRALVERLARLAGYAGELREDGPGSPRSSDVPYQRADISHLTRSGWQPRHTLDEALEQLWDNAALTPESVP